MAPRRCERGTGRRVAIEVAEDSVEDGSRNLFLVLRIGQALRIGRIGEKSGLDENRGNVGRLQDQKARLLDPALVAAPDAAERPEHLASDLGARAASRRLLQVDQNRSEQVVLAVDGDAADEIRRVFLLRKPSRRLAARPAARQDIHGASRHARVPERIGVDGHEHVRAAATCNLGSAPETDIVVAVANHYRLHARRAVDAALESAGNGQHDVLFLNPRSGDGAGIFAAVSGIDGDDDLAPALRSTVCGPPGWRRPRCLAT